MDRISLHSYSAEALFAPRQLPLRRHEHSSLDLNLKKSATTRQSISTASTTPDRYFDAHCAVNPDDDGSVRLVV